MARVARRAVGGEAPLPGLGGAGRERPGPLPSPPEFAARWPERRGAQALRAVPALACQPLALPPRAAGAPPCRAPGWDAGLAANFAPALRSAALRGSGGGRAGGARPSPGLARFRCGLPAPSAAPRAGPGERSAGAPGACQVEGQLAVDSPKPLLDSFSQKQVLWVSIHSPQTLQKTQKTARSYLQSLRSDFFNSRVVTRM